jgi:hypothetical protein
MTTFNYLILGCSLLLQAMVVRSKFHKKLQIFSPGESALVLYPVQPCPALVYEAPHIPQQASLLPRLVGREA